MGILAPPIPQTLHLHRALPYTPLLLSLGDLHFLRLPVLLGLPQGNAPLSLLTMEFCLSFLGSASNWS